MDKSKESPWHRRSALCARPLAPSARAMWRALSKPSPENDVVVPRLRFARGKENERADVAVNFLNGLVSLTGAPRVGDASLRSSSTMTASTIAIRPARASDVAAIESFVERYALVGHTVRFLDSADRPAPRAYASTSAHALTPPPIAPSGPRRPAARRLYGALDVGRLVERATVAVVAEEGGAVVAFLAVTARAPMPDTSGADGHHDASARLAWAKRTALELTSPGGTRFECGSTLWLAACATAPALQVSARAVLRRMLRECFARAPLAPRSLFFAGPNAVEQTPIGSLIEKRATNTDGMTTDKSSDEKKTKFALYSCARKDVAPAPIARDARLEDYDDLFSLAAHASAASGRGGPRAVQ